MNTLRRLLRTRSLLRPATPRTPAPAHPRPGVPDRVLLADLPIPLTPSTDPLIGLAAGNQPVHLTPAHGHTLVVMPSGYGASSLLQNVAAQLAATGVRVDILDFQNEQGWAHGVDGITHWSEPLVIHAFLQDLAEQVRKQPTAPAPAARTRVLIVETAVAHDLPRFRRGPGYAAAPLDALVAILAHGRPHGLHVIMSAYGVPQPLRAPARHLLTTRILANPDMGTWAALAAPGERRPTDNSDHVGRARLLGPNAARTELQLLYLTGQQALDLATGNHPTTTRPKGPTA
ncbi:hypothetical protein [Streptacidiphilus sp. EB103A]|uniref:hypothetical protein n=1 Tax=Streptacidiphilus sp. EB103A TaxID=3156275 RepID=UPI00351562A5